MGIWIKRLNWWKLVASLLLLASCKLDESQTELPGASMNEAEMPTVSSKDTAANAEYELDKTGAFFYSVWDGEFILSLNKLPITGEATKKPYSGFWYPESSGGTNQIVAGDSTPLAKYDSAYATGGSAAEWERTHHNSDVSWAGHCNGFSSAAQRHVEPNRNVTRNGVTFHPKDVKALLAEVYMGAKYFFLGGNRCEQQGTITSSIYNRSNPEFMAECEDINPGTFHAALANWVGVKKHTIIFDKSTNEQVWNYPVYYFYVDMMNEISKTEALDLLGQSSRTSYVFNANATSWYRVSTRVTYANAIGYEEITGNQPYPKSATFDYILEVNAESEIVGGEWLFESATTHPDFLWVSLEPMVGAGTRFNGNPYLDPNEVIRLWAESAGFDPEKPPLDIVEPIDSKLSSWGKFKNYEVTIDGSNRGATFLGKPVRIGVKRLGGFTGTLTVTIFMNGKAMSTATTTKDYDTILLNLEPPPGVNKLDIVWKKENTNMAEDSLRFHALP